MCEYSSAVIVCTKKRTAFPRAWKTVSFERGVYNVQRQICAHFRAKWRVLFILQTFFVTHAVFKWQLGNIQLCEHIFKFKWCLPCWFSFKYFSQHAGSTWTFWNFQSDIPRDIFLNIIIMFSWKNRLVIRLSMCAFLEPARSSQKKSDLKTTKERLRLEQGLYGGLTVLLFIFSWHA